MVCAVKTINAKNTKKQKNTKKKPSTTFEYFRGFCVSAKEVEVYCSYIFMGFNHDNHKDSGKSLLPFTSS